MKKSSLCIVLAILLVFGVRFLLHTGLRSNQSGVFDKFNTVFLGENNYNTIFIGSSRAETHFNPRIFDSINGTNSYNIGMQGATMPFIYTVLKAYLVHSKVPQTIILNIDHHFRFEKTDTVFMYPRYFPYLSNNELYTGLKQRDKRFVGFRYIPFYSLAHMGEKYLNASARGFLNRPNEYDLAYEKGFAWLSEKNEVNMDSVKIESYVSRSLPEVQQYLDSIILLSEKIKARLVLVSSPFYEKGRNAVLNFDEQLNAIKTKASDHGLDFYDYSRHDICADKNLFGDYYHLNASGAALFSWVFSDDFHNKSHQKPLK